MTTAAILLAGGRGSRLGGVDKAALRLGGATLLDRALDALGGLAVVVVGPARAADRPGVVRVREDPPLGGPAAAVVAGLAALPPSAGEVLLLAVDLVDAAGAVAALRTAPAGPDGVVAVDEQGRDQWLLGRYRAAALHDAAAGLREATGAPLRALVGGLDVARVPLPVALTADLDTPDDAAAAGALPPAT